MWHYPCPIEGHPPPPAGQGGGGFRGPPPDEGYNRFSWHNPEVNPRHSVFEDELQLVVLYFIFFLVIFTSFSHTHTHSWPNQGNNPFVYRRNDGPSYGESQFDQPDQGKDRNGNHHRTTMGGQKRPFR